MARATWLRKLAALVFVALFSTLIGAGRAAATQEQAGVSAAVRGQVQRASDTQPIGVQVVSGQPIYLADRISSGAQSGMQIMLLDQTTFTIGPDSFVKIDEFVYDPATNVGKVTASLGKGVFRFVSGKIALQNPSNMTVKLPVATIGIRGTMVYGRSDENSAVVGLAGAGPNNNTGDKPAGIDVITPQGTAEVRRPGWGVNVVRGQAPTVQKLPKPLVDEILNSVAPRDVVNALNLSAGVTNAAQASTLSVTAANRSSGQSSASAQPSSKAFGTAGNPNTQCGSSACTTLASTSPGGNGGDVSGNGSFDSANFAEFGCFFGADCPGFDSSLAALTTFGALQGVHTGVATLTESSVPIISFAGLALGQFQVIGRYIFTLTIDFGRSTANLTFSGININGAGATVNNATISTGAQSYAGITPASTPAFFVTSATACGNVICQGEALLNNSGATVAAKAEHFLFIEDVNNNGLAIGKGLATR